ncbi:MAG: methionyl-tRNA formyltransferase [Pseudonocardiaceae bacterium]
MSASRRIRIVLFSEVNSKLGSPFLDLLAEHPLVDLVAVVTSRPGRLCPYFVDDPKSVDLEKQGHALGVPVLRPRSVNDAEVVAELTQLRSDYFIVANFQQIMRGPLLAAPGETAINFHPSPLPRYAGLAPFYWMVRNGEQFGAVTAIEMDAGVDTGDIVMQRSMPLTGQETALKLRTAQENANIRMLADLVPELVDRSLVRTPQDFTHRSYYGRPTQLDHLLDFTRSAEDVRRVVRAGYRSPGARATQPDSADLIVLSVGVMGQANRDPVEPPGTVRHTADGLFVAANDEWVRIISVEHQRREVMVSECDDLPMDGVVLTCRLPEALPA